MKRGDEWIAELRRKHNGQHSSEEGFFLEKMTEIWMKMDEDECAKARSLLMKVPCAKRYSKEEE